MDSIRNLEALAFQSHVLLCEGRFKQNLYAVRDEMRADDADAEIGTRTSADRRRGIWRRTTLSEIGACLLLSRASIHVRRILSDPVCTCDGRFRGSHYAVTSGADCPGRIAIPYHAIILAALRCTALHCIALHCSVLY